MKPTITAIVIAKNEEARIGACLTHLSWATTRIVVDNGSTDKTREIAKKQSAIVIEDSQKDFSALRDTGLRHASDQWVVYVDADETVTAELAHEIEEVISSYQSGAPIGYYILRDTYYLGRHWPYRDRVQRLFLRSAIKGWHGTLHETPLYVGEVKTLKNPLEHRTHRTLEEMLAKTNEWSSLEAELRLKAHHPPVVWWRLLRVMVTGFSRSLFGQAGWRAGTVGWIESIYQGFSMFVTYAKLWEMQQKKQRL